MLGAATTSSSLGSRLPPVQLSGDLDLCLGWQTQLLLSHLQVHPVGKLSICPRKTHRDTHTEDTHTASYTERVLPSAMPTHRIDIGGKPREPYLLILLGWQRQEVTHAGAHVTPPAPWVTNSLVQLSAWCKQTQMLVKHHWIIES